MLKEQEKVEAKKQAQAKDIKLSYNVVIRIPKG